MQLYELQEIAGSLAQAIILGKSSSILGFNISSMSITNPIPSPSDSAWIKVRKSYIKMHFSYFKCCLFLVFHSFYISVQ